MVIRLIKWLFQTQDLKNLVDDHLSGLSKQDQDVHTIARNIFQNHFQNTFVFRDSRLSAIESIVKTKIKEQKCLAVAQWILQREQLPKEVAVEMKGLSPEEIEYINRNMTKLKIFLIKNNVITLQGTLHPDAKNNVKPVAKHLFDPTVLNQVTNNLWRDACSKKVFGNNKKYQFSHVVETIDKARAGNKKVCLFIGRRPSEELPAVREDEVWFTADIGMEKEDIGLEEKHIWLDFNQQDMLNILQSKFDLVVVDHSTTKHLEKDFGTRLGTLLSSKESQLVFEAFKGNIMLKLASETLSNLGFNADTYAITALIDDDESAKNERIRTNEEELKKHLLKSYDHVELVQNQSCPFFKQEVGSADYFIISGTKRF